MGPWFLSPPPSHDTLPRIEMDTNGEPMHACDNPSCFMAHCSVLCCAAQAYATLADIHFAMEDLDSAAACVSKAVAAAEGAGEWALAVKFSNNLGAVMKKQGKKEEVLEQHRRMWGCAAEKLGRAHPYALLARANVVESLDEMGQREEARWVEAVAV